VNPLDTRGCAQWTIFVQVFSRMLRTPREFTATRDAQAGITSARSHTLRA
jgi:hypothetical protein